MPVYAQVAKTLNEQDTKKLMQPCVLIIVDVFTDFLSVYAQVAKVLNVWDTKKLVQPGILKLAREVRLWEGTAALCLLSIVGRLLTQ